MANDVMQLIIGGTCAGEFWETVQHYECSAASGADPVGEADALITGFRGAVEGTMLDAMAADVTFFGYKSKRVNNGGGPVVSLAITGAVGQIAGTSATSATAMCIVSRFPHLGKWKTGRWFIPGLPESGLTGNSLTAPQIALLADIIAANVNFSNGGFGFTYGTWSAKFSLFFPPTYIAPSQKIGIQRRRLLPI